MKLFSLSSFPLRRNALLLAALLSWSTPLPVVRADAVSDAEARVDAAGTDLEKLNALFKYAQALNGMDATRDQLLKARKALKQSLALIDKIEATGDRLEPQSHFHYMAGLVAVRLEDYAGAIRFFNDAERKNFVAENATARHKGALLFGVRGEAKWKNYDYAGALADFNRALELNSEKGYYSQRARLHFEMGNADAARSDWAKGDKFTSGEQNVAVDVARERARLDGLSTQAIDEFPFDAALLPFNQAIARNPRATQPLLERATYLIRRGAGGGGGAKAEIAKAQRDINYALRLEPASPQAFHLRARALWRLAILDGKLHDAETDKAILSAFSRALQNAGDPVALRFDVGEYFLTRAQLLRPQPLAPAERSKALESAVFNYSYVIRLDPQNTLARAKRIRAEQLSERPDFHLVLTDSAVIARNGLTAAEGADAAEIETLKQQVESARVQALLQSGAWTEAETELQSALQKYPNQPSFLQMRGQLHTLRGRYDEAIKDLQSALNTSRFHAPSWWWLGLALDGKGNTAQAKQALDNALKIDARLAPQTIGTRYAADKPTDKPIVTPPVAGDVKPQGTALQHKDAGNALKLKNDVTGALAEYSIALQIDPNFTDALNNRALIYAEQSKVDLALADINRALELEPKHRIASLVRADIRAALGETTLALEDANNAVLYADTDARRTSALISRARLHGRLKDKTSALKDLTDAEKLAADNAEQLKNIAELRVTLEK
jgi:tetratricopeptide (TPR) repeat protein